MSLMGSLADPGLAKTGNPRNTFKPKHHPHTTPLNQHNHGLPFRFREIKVLALRSKETTFTWKAAPIPSKTRTGSVSASGMSLNSPNTRELACPSSFVLFFLFSASFVFAFECLARDHRMWCSWREAGLEPQAASQKLYETFSWVDYPDDSLRPIETGMSLLHQHGIALNPIAFSVALCGCFAPSVPHLLNILAPWRLCVRPPLNFFASLREADRDRNVSPTSAWRHL